MSDSENSLSLSDSDFESENEVVSNDDFGKAPKNSSKEKVTGNKRKHADDTRKMTKATSNANPISSIVAKKPSPASKTVAAASKSTVTTSATNSVILSQNKPDYIMTDDSKGDITKGPAVATEASAKKLIQQYMTLQNRPYSAIQVFDNLHGRVPKSTVQKVLDSLTSTNVLNIKEYGKAKIYYVDQVAYSYYVVSSCVKTTNC